MDQRQLLHILGERIRAIRKAKDISQEKLAELAGLHPTYISDIERGKVNASIYVYYLVATALDMRFVELIDLPSDITDAKFENEIVQIFIQVRKLDEKKRHLFLSSIKGLLSGIEGE